MQYEYDNDAPRRVKLLPWVVLQMARGDPALISEFNTETGSDRQISVCGVAIEWLVEGGFISR